MRTSLLSVFVAMVAFPSCVWGFTQSPKDWQIKSLKGISLIEYGVTKDPDNKLAKTLATELGGTGVPLKSINLKADSGTPLSKKEARLKVSVDDRENGQSWVGLYIQQKADLNRDPSVTFEPETYGVGTLCPKSKVNETVKDLCVQFVHDFNSQKTPR